MNHFYKEYDLNLTEITPLMLFSSISQKSFEKNKQKIVTQIFEYQVKDTEEEIVLFLTDLWKFHKYSYTVSTYENYQ